MTNKIFEVFHHGQKEYVAAPNHYGIDDIAEWFSKEVTDNIDAVAFLEDYDIETTELYDGDNTTYLGDEIAYLDEVKEPRIVAFSW